MTIRAFKVFSLATWIACGLVLGCVKPATPATEKTEKTEKTEETEKTEKKTTAEAPPEHKPLPPDPIPATPPKAGPGKGALKVTLGPASPELYAGIPGGGDLLHADLEKWLADPKNHEVIEVVLPLGLDAGTRDIQGVKENPLTRAKIELGRQLYFDTRLSKDQSISCSSCHDPDEGFAAHTQFGIGIDKQQGGRNSPVAYNRILSGKQFWDGRAASLEAQAVGPIANPIEMGNTHEACVACLKEVKGYALQFDKIFGRFSIDTVAEAIAAFERTLVSGPAPYDYHQQLQKFSGIDPEDLQSDDPEQYKQYLQAQADAKAHPMSESAVRGMKIYFSTKGQCSACHVGPNLTDEKYHNLGIGMDAKSPDLGRFDQTKQESDQGAFKTPTVRNVVHSAPYMHDGSLKNLEEVIDWYDKGGHPNPHLDKDIKKLNLSKAEKADLLAFLKKGVTGDFPKIERGRLPQ